MMDMAKSESRKVLLGSAKQIIGSSWFQEGDFLILISLGGQGFGGRGEGGNNDNFHVRPRLTYLGSNYKT